MIRKFLCILTALLCITFTSCLKEDALKVPFQSLSPAHLGDGWEVASPAAVGMDGERLTALYRYAHDSRNVWQIRSLLVFKDHKLVAESYMKNAADQARLHPIWSNTKQVVGILTGIAVDKGLISIDSALSDYLPQVAKYSEKSRISIENLLTMKSGIGYNNDGYYGEDSKLSREAPASSIDFILGLKMQAAPGAAYRYKNSDPHLLSAILQEKVGRTARDWAKDVLFDKIGVGNLEWRTYKDGVTFGGFGILATPREMGKIGQLVANGGAWNGAQIVSTPWIDQMTAAHVSPDETREADIAFGYLWWRDVGRNVVFARGHGGQYILINRAKNLVIVITSEPHPAGEFGLSVREALSIYDRVDESEI